MLARQVTPPDSLQTELTPFLPCPCSLFAVILRLPSFVFNSLQPLFPKHPGRGPTSTHPVSPAHPKCVLSVSTFKMNTYAKPGGRGLPALRALCGETATKPKRSVPQPVLCRLSTVDREPLLRGSRPTFSPLAASQREE